MGSRTSAYCFIVDKTNFGTDRNIDQDPIEDVSEIRSRSHYRPVLFLGTNHLSAWKWPDLCEHITCSIPICPVISCPKSGHKSHCP